MPPVHIALLRAINVGGKGVMKMDALRNAFAAAGAVNPRTFIASGNVVFGASSRGQAALFARISAEVSKLTAHPRICFRTLDELDRVVAANPFGALTADPRLKLYVAFLQKPPHQPVKLPMISEKEALEVAAFEGREAFIISRPIPGRRMYGFPNNFIETLGVTATTRTWSTVQKLAAFARRGA